MTICLVDTSIFCELLEVPKLASKAKQMAEALSKKLDSNERSICLS